MNIKIRLTEQILNDSLKLHYRYFGSGHRRRLLAIPAILVAISVYLIYTELQKPKTGNNFYLGFLYIAFAIGYYFYTRYRMQNMGKTLLKNMGENINFEMVVTNEEVKTILPSSTTSTNWTVFTGAIISNDIVMLYQQNNSFSMFNKTFFENENEFAEFKQLVEKNIAATIKQ
ncbi:MAG TPA: hypothetical protein VFN30_12825 [Chitinophagaceae bacterium]|nr:hypothetical protein [Chitinophagaceae bacterium]